MSRRPLLPLLCLLAWAPVALAFPPCPMDPVDLLDADDVDAVFSPDSYPWSRGWYLRYDTQREDEGRSAPDDIDSGKCRDHDQVPVPQTMTPGGEPFGIVVLPDLRFVDGKLTASYTLRFDVDTQPLATPGDNVELARLEFETTESTGLEYPQTLTAVYRVRKRQAAYGAPVLEVLESRMPVDPTTRQVTPNAIVIATLPMPASDTATAIGLRWTQSPGDIAGVGGPIELPAPTPSPGDTLDGMAGTESLTSPLPVFARNVDSRFEVLDGAGTVLHRTSLPAQWASTLSMGLLDRRLVNPAPYADPHVVRLGGMSLDAEAQ